MGYKEYVVNLYQDAPPFIYLCLFAILIIGTFLILSIKGIKNGWRQTGKLLLLENLVLLYCTTVIFRSTNINQGHNFRPFWSYIAISNGKEDLIAENIMNIIVFIPFGIFVGLAFQRIKWWHVLILILLVSLSVEFMQYFFNRGFSEFDDVLHNTLGGLIGYCVYKITEYVVISLREIIGKIYTICKYGSKKYLVR